MRVATPKETASFAKKFSHYKDFYTNFDGLIFSKLGIGTFVKEPYKEENYLFHYIEAIKKAVEVGINVIDTASNYRYTQSEKEIATALDEMGDKVKREELIICSKGGFIQLSYPFPKNPYEWIEENIISKNLAKREDIELDQHCMTPDFLEFSCRESLKNLKIDSLDIYYLHNPEMQLLRLGEDEFYKLIEKIFKKFEKLSDEGLFKYYGVATWNGFTNPLDSKERINLEKLVKIAKKVGGKNHRFKFIQLPFNLGKTDAYTQFTQTLNGEKLTVLQSAYKLGIGVISSSSLLQMNLFKKSFSPEIGAVLDKDMVLESDIQLALQFCRSTRGVVTSLFSSKVPTHITHNSEISKIKAISMSRYNLIYKL